MSLSEAEWGDGCLGGAVGYSGSVGFGFFFPFKKEIKDACNIC